MPRAKDRLVLSRAATRRGMPTGGHRFLDEMGLTPSEAGRSIETRESPLSR
jgi:hypothetical protein